MLKKPLKIGEFYKGLSALGKLEQDKFQTLTNCDIHSETGMVQPQLAMVSESTTPNEPCVNAQDNAGNTYFCSTTTGKIWKRTTAGAYSLVHTNTNTAHTGCQYFNGYLWYWTATKLGSYDLSTTWNDAVATGTAFRGSTEANNTLLIANGRYIARIDAENTVDLEAFVVPAQFKVTCLLNIGDDILVGTYISTDVSYCKVFLWNSVADAWSYEDEIYEIGVNVLMKLDNVAIAQCGTTGNFYYWNGSQMVYFGRIKGITTALGEQKALVYKRRPLFANATKIYSIHKEANGLPYAFANEYTCTGTIQSLAAQGQTLLASVGTGVDKVGTAYATAVIETAEIQSQISNIKIGYDVYPAGIGVETSINGATYVAQTETVDTTEKEVTFNGGTVDGHTTQIRVTLTPSGANLPKLKYIELQ